jgi:hypothetical protein
MEENSTHWQANDLYILKCFVLVTYIYRIADTSNLKLHI